MKVTSKIAICMALAAVMWVTALTACGKDGESSGVSEQTTSTTSAQTSQMTQSETSSEDTTGKISEENAVNLLAQYSAEELGLEAALTSYMLLFNDNTNMVEDLECYMVNVFDSSSGVKEKVAVFCVAVDGSIIYRVDPLTDEYVEVQSGVAANTEEQESFDQPSINPLDDEPAAVINTAMMVYSWFELGSIDVDVTQTVQMPFDNDDEVNTWYRVADENINTYESMQAFLHNFFSEEITQALLAKGVCKEAEDGYLYFANESREVTVFIENVDYDIKSSTDTRVVYEAEVTYGAGFEGEDNIQTMEFVCEQIDGAWVFTQFPYFY